VGHMHAHGHHSGPPEPRVVDGSHPGARFSGRLTATFALTAAFFVVELIAGLLARSLSLIADAGHMATDVVALGGSVVATRIAARPDGSGRRTYGRYRAEVFAAGLACLLMVGAGLFVLVEAIRRINAPAHPATGWMLVVGALGLLVNLAALLILRSGRAHSINVRGAYVEVLGDAAGSAGVLIAGGLIQLTGNPIWDVVVALLIAVFVLVRAWGLARSVLRVLGQHIPEGMDLSGAAGELAAIEGVLDVHDLHVWALTSGMNVATAHLRTAAGADGHRVLDEAHSVLARHHIEHATVQVEPPDHETCHEVSW
jgi:cobalt-zinc-cadmium efflux system protein